MDSGHFGATLNVYFAMHSEAKKLKKLEIFYNRIYNLILHLKINIQLENTLMN